MDVAFRSLIVFFLIVIPGATFRRFYYSGEFSKQFHVSWSKFIFYSLGPGIVIQYFTLISYHQTIRKFTSDDIVHFIKENSVDYFEIINNIFTFAFFKYIIIYVCILFFISFLSAQLLYRIVRLTKLDRRTKLFRFYNHWHYYLSAEYHDFYEIKNIKRVKSFGKELNTSDKLVERFFPYVDVLVQLQQDKTRMYSGLIVQHSINAKEELENIYLTLTSRYNEKNCFKEEGVKKIPIPGDLMVIPANRIINFNLRQIKVSFPEQRAKTIKKLKIATQLLSIVFLLWTLFLLVDYWSLFENFNYKTSLWFTSLAALSFIEELMKKYVEKKENKKKEAMTLFIGLLFLSAAFWAGQALYYYIF